MNDQPPPPPRQRKGVVAVCHVQQRFLVIRRGRNVEAPLAYCFPGGGIEDGEEEVDALVRELQEELSCSATPIQRLWRSETDWRVQLAWWQVSISQPGSLTPNPREVDSVHWLTESELRALPGLLSSNIAFLDALRQGAFSLAKSD